MSKKHIALALQGGGSHGAFTWGVLDAILEDDRMIIDGISGTSAGGMGAAAMAQGLAKGGSEGARKELESYWKHISEMGKKMGMEPSALDKMIGKFGMDYVINPILMFKHTISPYVWNPLNLNALEKFASEFFDFDLINKGRCKVFLSATQVRTAKIKIFGPGDINAKTLMASACLPTMFQAVEYKGEFYWDGGFIGNPAIFPLIDQCTAANDVVTILLSPFVRPEVPKSQEEIKWRHFELSVLNTLTRELRAIRLISQLIDDGTIPPDRMRRIRTHTISDEDTFRNLSHSSPMNSSWEFLEFLFTKGRICGKKWIEKNFNDIGVKDTADLSYFDTEW